MILHILSSDWKFPSVWPSYSPATADLGSWVSVGPSVPWWYLILSHLEFYSCLTILPGVRVTFLNADDIKSLLCFRFFSCSHSFRDKADIFDLTFKAGLDLTPGPWDVSSTFHPCSDDDHHHHDSQCALHLCPRQHSVCAFATAPITRVVITCLSVFTPTQVLSTAFSWAGAGPCSYLCSPWLMLNGEPVHVWMIDAYHSVPSVCYIVISILSPLHALSHLIITTTLSSVHHFLSPFYRWGNSKFRKARWFSECPTTDKWHSSVRLQSQYSYPAHPDWEQESGCLRDHGDLLHPKWDPLPVKKHEADLFIGKGSQNDPPA